MSISQCRIITFFLDVGQGDCTFIILPDRRSAVLLDCADAYVADRFVSDRDVEHLSAIVVSHLDRDHIGGMLSFMKSFLKAGGSVGKVYVGIDRVFPAGNGSAKSTAEELLEQLMRWAADGYFEICAPMRDDDQPKCICEGEGWCIELILPRYQDMLRLRLSDGEKPNDCSAVLRLVCGDQAILMGADAPMYSWEKLEARLLPAAAFRVPHHGGNLGVGRKWELSDLYENVGADLCVYSVGTRNSYGHPFPGHVKISRRDGKCRILCTQLTGRCHENPHLHREKAIENVSGVVYPYRHHMAKLETPCAGSVMVVLGSSGCIEIEPSSADWHDDFVALMNTPLCR